MYRLNKFWNRDHVLENGACFNKVVDDLIKLKEARWMRAVQNRAEMLRMIMNKKCSGQFFSTRPVK